MAKTAKLRERASRAKVKMFGKYSVVKNALALTFLFLSFVLVSYALGKVSDIGRLFVVIYGLVVVVLSVSLIVEFALKTYRAQIDAGVVRYSALASSNALFGLVLPMLFLNLTVLSVMRVLWRMSNYSTVWCEMRRGLVNMYYQHNVYWQINNLIMLTVIVVITLFLWGGVLERTRRAK